jgi:hypothetical protein
LTGPDAVSAHACSRSPFSPPRKSSVSTLAHLGTCHHLVGDHATADEQWCHADALLGDLDPSATEQIHVQLAIIDGSAAEAFRRRGRK